MEQPQTRYARTTEGYVGYQVLGEGPLDILMISEWTQNIDVMWEHPPIAGFLRGLASLGRSASTSAVTASRIGCRAVSAPPQEMVPRLSSGLERELGIEIRAGLHTGELQLLGNDVAGIAVDTAARVMALADPGEVLVSSTVRDLVAGAGLEFEDRGARVLKGVPGEWRVFAAR